MIEVRNRHVTLYVDRSSQQWVVLDTEGNFWVLPNVENPWDQRQPIYPTEETELEPVPGHYEHMLGLPISMPDKWEYPWYAAWDLAYFHGDNGAGLGANHQTGWTGVVARLMHLFATMKPEAFLQGGKKAYFEAQPKAATADLVGAR